jgi:hypothetical protein
VHDRRAEKPLTDRNDDSDQSSGDVRHRHGRKRFAMHKKSCTGAHLKDRLRLKRETADRDDPAASPLGNEQQSEERRAPQKLHHLI